MFQRRLVIGALAVLLLLGLFLGISSAMQRDAWMQGYMVGRLSAGSDGGSAANVPPWFYPGYGGWGPGAHFGGFGLIFGLLLLFLLFVGVSRFLRFRGWGQPGGPGAGAWGRHGHRPPWWGEEQTPESKPEQGGRDYV